MELWWNHILTRENQRTRRETYLSATLSATNPTLTDRGANPDLRGERPASNLWSEVGADMRYSVDITRGAVYNNQASGHEHVELA
jgi:hypothetical protein